MGYYLNNTEPMELYKKVCESPYFVDKSKIISELTPLINEESRYVCITRPRRFGKSVVASMIAAYYSKGGDAADLFKGAAVAEDKENYEKHLNTHNVFYMDMSKVDDECENYKEYISGIKSLLRDDLHEEFPDVKYREEGTVYEDLKKINNATGETFLFVIDEWDAPFHMRFLKEEDRGKYFLFLKNLLRANAYVGLAYMTGILPIAKYSSGSELNMFQEYTMAKHRTYSGYFGFTDEEVDELYGKYLRIQKSPMITREGIRSWYDGYYIPPNDPVVDGEGNPIPDTENEAAPKRLYNPRSVVLALSNNQLSSYWTSSGPYDEIFYYVKNDIAGVRDDIAKMIAGEEVRAQVQEYSAISTEIGTRDEVLSAMTVYGFLTALRGRVSIPNKELMDKFVDMVRKENDLGYVYSLAKESDRMLAATKTGDTETMASILQQAHDTETGMTGYNDEAELSAIVKLVYLSARDDYDMEREDKAGVGYVDYIFYPKENRTDDCIIVELKVDSTADEAIGQIKSRGYAQRFLGKLGEIPKYRGRILAVGISYYKKDPKKKHECKVEVLREKL